MLKTVSLKNSLNVLRYQKSSSKIFVIGFLVKTGSVYEGSRFPLGISKIMERMFLRGTHKHPSKRHLSMAIEAMGGQIVTYTSSEYTEFYLQVPSYHQYKAVSLLSEIIQHSYFDSRDLQQEIEYQIDKLKLKEETIATELDILSTSNIYPNHPLSNPREGSIDSILSINQENVLEYLASQYIPSNCYLILAGNFDNKPLSELVEQEWSYWNPKMGVPVEYPEVNFNDMAQLPNVVYKQKGISVTQINLGFVLDGGYLATNKEEEIDFNSESSRLEYIQSQAYLDVLTTVLGQGMSSRLWVKGVEEEMFFQNIQANLIKFKQTGFLEITGLTDNNQFTFALESVLTVLEALKKTTVSINELSKIKEFLKGSLIFESENLLSDIRGQVAQYVSTGYSFTIEEILNAINEVEAAPLRALCMALFVPERMFLSTIGTAKETAIVNKLIRNYLE